MGCLLIWGLADEDAERQQGCVGGGDLRRGRRAGDGDLILVDDGGAADQHNGIGITAGGVILASLTAAIAHNFPLRVATGLRELHRRAIFVKTEGAAMSHDSNLEEEIVTRLRRAVADAERRGYERGVRETMAKIQSFVMPVQTTTSFGGNDQQRSATPHDDNSIEDDNVTQVEGRKRAPKGLVRKVVKQALSQTPGLTPAQIQNTAQTALERMIQAGSYRSELR